MTDSSNDKVDDCPAAKLVRSMNALQRVVSDNVSASIPTAPKMNRRTKSCPQFGQQDDC